MGIKQRRLFLLKNFKMEAVYPETQKLKNLTRNQRNFKSKQMHSVRGNNFYTVQKEQGVRLVSLMQHEIILYMASAICVSSYLADFYLLSKFASLE
jgi:hypothetical protein